MKVNKRIAGLVVLAGLLIGSLGAGLAFSSQPQTASAAPAQQTQPVDSPPTGEEDTTQDPTYAGSLTVDESQIEGLSETDEAAAQQGQASISADNARTAAEAANPGATAVKVELDNENGLLVYSVELDNGLDVKIDVGDASVLHTEQAGEDGPEAADEAGDSDDVQEEFEAGNEADDATEGPETAEDAAETAPVP